MSDRALLVRVPMLERIAGTSSALPPALAAILTRGRFSAGPPDQSLAALLGCAALPAPGPLSRLGSSTEGDPGTGDFWLRADVVRMIPDLAAVWVERPLAADLCADALAPLRCEFDAMFAAEGIDWAPEPGAGHALVRLAAAPACRFVDRDAARGRRLDEVLPTGSDASRWRRLINESQMIFHQFRSLDRPDQHGAGLWFWGGGTMPAPGAARAAPPASTPALTVSAAPDDHLARGLARWLGAAHASAVAFEDGAAGPRLLRWRADAGVSFDALERDWLAPALAALMRGRLGEIAVIGDAGAWRFGRWSGLARWRRNDRFLDEHFLDDRSTDDRFTDARFAGDRSGNGSEAAS